MTIESLMRAIRKIDIGHIPGCLGPNWGPSMALAHEVRCLRGDEADVEFCVELSERTPFLASKVLEDFKFAYACGLDPRDALKRRYRLYLETP